MATKLLILGLLMEKARHPYEIRQMIKARNWDHVFQLKDGSLYYAVDQMKQEGFIEITETIPVPGNNRPDKTVYTITELGKTAFLERLYDKLELDAYPQHPLFIGLPFAGHADQRVMEQILVRKMKTCEQRVTRLKGVLELKGDTIPLGARHLIQGMIRFSETESEWLADVLKDAQAGKLSSCGEHEQKE